MGDLKHLIVQILDETDRSFAQSVLQKHGDVSPSQYYIRGYGDEEDIKLLEDEGMIVEYFGQDYFGTDTKGLLPGLAPEEQDDAEALSDEAEFEEGSPIKEVGADSPTVFLLQLKGPLRSAWKEQLDKLGVTLIDYKPDFAYKSMMSGNPHAALDDLDFVARVIDNKPSQRLRALKEKTRRAGALWKQQCQSGQEQYEAPEVETEYEAQGPTSELWPEVPSVAAVLTELAPPPTAAPETPATPAPTLLRYELKCHLADQIPVLAEALKKDPRIKNLEVGRVRIRFACEENSPVLKELAEKTQIVSRVDPYIEPEIGTYYARIGIGIEKEDKPLLPWNGKDIIVGVADTGVDKTHPDLKEKLVEVIPRAGKVAESDENGHGTHVCGIVAGDGTASDGKLHGIASGAKLIVQGIVNEENRFTGLPIDMADLFQEAYDKKVRIHNNSWGMAVKGLYSIDSYEVDEFIYENPDFLVIFSAGNDGRQTDDDHPDPEPEFGRILPMSLRAPGTSKNALTVGACCSPRTDGPYKDRTWRKYATPYIASQIADEPICGDPSYLAAFSSRGPSDDERVKPDLVAPGTVIASTHSSNAAARNPYPDFDGHYMYLSGTSQAAPVAAGAAAIVREFYIADRKHKNPSAALIKATLINGAQWIPRVTALWEEVGQPNFHQGFGRLDLLAALPVPGNPEGFRLLFRDVDRKSAEALNKSVSGKGRWTGKVQIAAGVPLRATLCWTDKPGKGLQQDLDLVVTFPDGKKKLVGNHLLKRLSAFPTDHRNNVEQVIIEKPEAGNYTINVLAYNTPFEDQGFSLVVTGKLMSDFLP